MHLINQRNITLLLAGAQALLAYPCCQAQPRVERVEIPCSVGMGQKLHNLGPFAVAVPAGAGLKKTHGDDSSVWWWRSKRLQLRIELGEVGIHSSDGQGFCAHRGMESVGVIKSVEPGWTTVVRQVASEDGLHDVRIKVRARPAFLQEALAAIASFQLAPPTEQLKLLAISEDARYAIVDFAGVAPIKVHVGDEISANFGTIQNIDAQGMDVEEYRLDAATGDWVTTDVRIPIAGAALADDRPTYPGHGLVRCADMSSVKPGQGRSFSGHLSGNGDYPFSVTIPRGLVTWDGVASSAPFHGFTILRRESGKLH